MSTPRSIEVLCNEPDWLKEPDPEAPCEQQLLLQHAADSLARWGLAPAAPAPSAAAEVEGDDARSERSVGPVPGRAASARAWVLGAGALAASLLVWAMVEPLDAEPPAVAAPAPAFSEAELEEDWPALLDEPAPATGAQAGASGAGALPPAAQPDEGASARAAAATLIARGAQLALRGEHRRAAATFWRATRAEPANADAWSGLALCQFELGNERAAAAAGKRALRLSPDHPEAAVLMGFIAQGRGAFQTSRQLYERYLAKNPTGDWAEELKSVLQQLPGDGPLAVHRPPAATRSRR